MACNKNGELHRGTRARVAVLGCALALMLACIPGIALADQPDTDGIDDRQTPVLEATATGSSSEGLDKADDETAEHEEGSVSSGEGVDGKGTSEDASQQEGTESEPEGEVTAPETSVTPNTDPAPSALPRRMSVMRVVQQAQVPAEVPLSIQYVAHVQDEGWQDKKADGALAGSVGKSRRLEALKVELVNSLGAAVKGISYRAHVQDEGWQNWVSDDAVAGSTGKSRRIEAVRICLSDELAAKYDVFYRVHAQDFGWLAWAKDGEAAGSSGQSKRIEALEIQLVAKGGAAPSSEGSRQSFAFSDGGTFLVTAHSANVGWQAAVSGGRAAGTTGRGLQLEALGVSLSGAAAPGGVEYQAHVQNVGWQPWVKNGAVAGTTGRGLQIEAIKVKLTGEAASLYDVYYRTHVANYGWLAWAKDGDAAGTSGLSQAVEAVQILLVKKGAGVSSNGSVTTLAFVSPASITYAAKKAGAKDFDTEVTDGKLAGSIGRSLAVDAIESHISMQDDLTGSVSYAVHVANEGWLGEKTDGAAAESSDEKNTVQAIRMRLTGEVAKFFDVYYRAHVSSVGWLDWACNGQNAGSEGKGLNLEAFEVKLVPKGKAAPGATGFANIDNSSAQLYRDANALQRRVVDSAKRTPSPGGNLCAAWVTQVIQNAGFGWYPGDARDLYDWYCHSSDRSQLKVGMVIGVRSHGHTYMGGIYGHICIYIGDGQVMDNVGRIRTSSLDWWQSWYGDRVPVRWGWLGNRTLA